MISEKPCGAHTRVGISIEPVIVHDVPAGAEATYPGSDTSRIMGPGACAPAALTQLAMIAAAITRVIRTRRTPGLERTRTGLDAATPTGASAHETKKNKKDLVF